MLSLPHHKLKDMAELTGLKKFYSIKVILLHLVEDNNLYLKEIGMFSYLYVHQEMINLGNLYCSSINIQVT